MFSLADFFTKYPNLEDPRFRTIISNKAEFLELEAPSWEDRPNFGELYKHQLYTIRYMDNYPKLLCIHEPGTGKSCIIIGSAEMFKREYLKDSTDPTKATRAIILIKNGKLKQNIREEIVKVCAPGVYNPEGEAVHDQRVTRAIGSWYDIITYREFSNILTGSSQRQIDNYLRNKVIYIDEAHNLIPATGAQDYVDEDVRAINYDLFYEALHNEFVRGVYLFTATPIIDNSRQFTSLANFIIPKKNRLSIDFDLADLPDKELDEFFKENLSGNISFVKAVSGDAVPVVMINENVPLPLDDVYGVPMLKGGFQDKAYAKTPFAQSKTGAITGGFATVERNLSNIALPPNPNMLLIGKDIENYSCKYAEIVRLANENYTETDPRKQGVTFVFSPHFVAILEPLRTFLEQAGFNEYAGEDEDPARISFGKRYVVITSDTSPKEFRSMYNILKHPRNMFGSLISVVIASRVAQEGISINNVSKSIILSSPWNPGNYIQAYNRVFRSTSHTDKVRYLRSNVDEYFRVTPGRPPVSKKRDLGENEMLEVEVYNMAAIWDPKRPSTSIDYRVYEISADKMQNLEKILNKCKEYAVDAISHRRRNLLDSEPIEEILERKGVDWTTKLQKYSQKEIAEVIRMIMILFRQRSVLSLDELYRKNDKIKREIVALSVEFLISNAVVIRDRYGYSCTMRATTTNDLYLDRYNLRQTGQDVLISYYMQHLDVNQDIDINTLQEFNRNALNENRDELMNNILDPNTPLIDKDVMNLKPAGIAAVIENVLGEVMMSGEMTEKQAKIIEFFKHFIYILPRRQTEVREIEEGNRLHIGRGRPPKNLEDLRVKQLDIDLDDTAQGYVLLHTMTDITNVHYNENQTIMYGSPVQRVYDFRTNTWYTATGVEGGIYYRLILANNNRIMEYFQQQLYYGILIPHRDIFKIVNNTKNAGWDEESGDKRVIYTGKNCDTWKRESLITIIYTYGIIDAFEPTKKAIPDFHASDVDAEIFLNDAYEYSQEFNILDKFSHFIANLPDKKNVTIEDIRTTIRESLKNSKSSTLCSAIKNYFLRRNLMYVGNDLSLDILLLAAQEHERTDLDDLNVSSVVDMWAEDEDDFGF